MSDNDEDINWDALNEAGDFQNRHHEYVHDARPWEISLRPELDQLPRVKVTAGDPAVLRAQGYESRKCHANCGRATEVDPTIEQVVGWTVGEEAYILHSVLRSSDGTLHCVTPDHCSDLDEHGQFEFVIDEHFELEGPHPFLKRDGVYANEIMHSVIRRNVEKTRTRYQALTERIRAGELTADEATALVKAGEGRTVTMPK